LGPAICETYTQIISKTVGKVGALDRFTDDLRSGEWMDLPQERQQKEFQLSHADVGWSQSATKGVLCVVDFEQVFLAESLLGTSEILHWSERS